MKALLICFLFFLLTGCASPETFCPSPMDPAWIDENRDDGIFGRYYTDTLAQEVSFEHLRAYTCYRADLRKLGLSAEAYTLLCYDSNTRFPKDLPAGYDPAAELEWGKDPGLGIRTLHERGITGKGVNIGIIDQTLVPHNEYAGRLRLYRNLDPENTDGSMHGAAVLSLAVGKTCGTAPEANVYYIASPSMDADLDALRQLLDLNRSLAPEDKLDILSISQGGYSAGTYAEMQALCAKQNIALITCKDMGVFGPVGRRLHSDPNDPQAILPCFLYLYGSNGWQGTAEQKVCVPIDRRTLAAMSGADSYYHMPFGGSSWIPPYIAGVFALARQIKPALTYPEFEALAVDTARSVTVQTSGGTEYIFPLLDPPTMIEALQK